MRASLLLIYKNIRNNSQISFIRFIDFERFSQPKAKVRPRRRFISFSLDLVAFGISLGLTHRNNAEIGCVHNSRFMFCNPTSLFVSSKDAIDYDFSHISRSFSQKKITGKCFSVGYRVSGAIHHFDQIRWKQCNLTGETVTNVAIIQLTIGTSI